MKTPTPIYQISKMPSPIGDLILRATEAGLAGIYMETHTHPLSGEASESAILQETRKQLDAYFSQQLKHFDLPLDLHGTAFQKSVWAALLTIPYGETRSYLQIAASIQNPKAVRAVGLANGQNPIAIVVPCHRVIGKNGTLTGYGGGLERKQFLLHLEEAGFSKTNLPTSARSAPA